MLKATSHAKSKTKTSPRELAHRGLFLFLILYGDSRTFAGALASANGHGRILRAYPIPYFSSLPPNSFSAAPAAPIIPLTVGFFRAPATIFT